MNTASDSASAVLDCAYEAWSPILVPALRRDAVWIDPSFELGLAADFEQRLRAAVAAAGADVRVAVGPALQRPRGSDLRFAEELFGRILDDLDSADPLVFICLPPGRWPGVWCYAYRRQGTSGRLVGPGELELLRGDFRQDPGPFVEYCAAAGRAWLGEGRGS